MKLPDFLEWSTLTALRNQMGAHRLGDLRLTENPNRLTEAELDRLVHGGLDVSSIDDVRVLPDGTLAYKDSRVLIYIRDVAHYKGSRGDGVRNLPRFHLANCETLQQMRREKRYERYVVAAREDGLFEVNFIENNRPVRSSPESLRVCQNCLALLVFGGFKMHDPAAVRERKVSSFRLDKFFEVYARALFLQTPAHRSDSAPLNTYPDDFEALSLRVKEERGWRCEGPECGVTLASVSLRRYLHLHHVNGQKHDSRPENLTVLCVACHADQPYHSHMLHLSEVQAFRSIRDELRFEDATHPSVEPAGVADRFSDEAFRAFARAYSLAHEDNRERGGALWVHVGANQTRAVPELRRWGFRYKEGRGWWKA